MAHQPSYILSSSIFLWYVQRQLPQIKQYEIKHRTKDGVFFFFFFEKCANTETNSSKPESVNEIEIYPLRKRG